MRNTRRNLFVSERASFPGLFLLYLLKSRLIVYSNEARHFLPPVKDHGEPEAPLFMVCDKINSKAMKESLLT